MSRRQREWAQPSVSHRPPDRRAPFHRCAIAATCHQRSRCHISLRSSQGSARTPLAGLLRSPRTRAIGRWVTPSLRPAAPARGRADTACDRHRAEASRGRHSPGRSRWQRRYLWMTNPMASLASGHFVNDAAMPPAVRPRQPSRRSPLLPGVWTRTASR